MVADTTKPFPPRLTTYVSVALTLFAAIVLAVVERQGWSWPLFAWGALLGPVWVGATIASTTYGMRYIAKQSGTGAAELSAAQERWRRRFLAVYPAYALMGLPWGIVSASIRSIWPDVAVTAYAVLGVGLPFALFPRLARRAAARHDAPSTDLAPP